MGKSSSISFSIEDSRDDRITTVSMHGAFFGSTAPAAGIEGLLAAHVPRRHIAEVADVYWSRWWDYRRMAPGHSFMLFATSYYAAFKVAARKMLQHRQRTAHKAALFGVGAMQFTAEEIWDREQAHITGMWKAMLMSDALGIPYEQFCQLACQVATATSWTRLPMPRQLYSEALAAQVLNRWEDLIKGRLFTAKHPLYDLENYSALQVQDNYRAWLIEQLKNRPDPTTALSTVLYGKPQLPIELVRGEFPAQSLNRARLLAA